MSLGNKNSLKEQKIAHQFPGGEMPAKWSASYKTLVTKGRRERKRQRQRRGYGERKGGGRTGKVF